MVKHEPEIRRAKAKLYVESCNSLVHEAPWTTGRTNGQGAGGLYRALEMAELAHAAHNLPYEQGLSKMSEYDPRRFTWICDESADNFVKVRDNKTGKLASWRWF
jgi:hypothetical protein